MDIIDAGHHGQKDPGVGECDGQRREEEHQGLDGDDPLDLPGPEPHPEEGLGLSCYFTLIGTNRSICRFSPCSTSGRRLSSSHWWEPKA